MVKVVIMQLLTVTAIDESKFLTDRQSNSLSRDTKERGRASIRRYDQMFIVVYGR